MIYISAFVRPNKSRPLEKERDVMSCITEETINWFAEDFGLPIKEEGGVFLMDTYAVSRRGYENYVADLVREYLAPHSGTIDRIETLKQGFDEATGFAVYAGDVMVLKVAPWSWSEGEPFTGIGVGVEIWPVVEQVTGSGAIADDFEGVSKLPDPYVLSWDGQSWSMRRAS